MIYVMGERRVGVVKIGRAVNPVERLRAIQTGYPMPLRLQCVFPGDHAEEQWLHRRFATLRMSDREWFDFRDEDSVASVGAALALLEADPDLDPHADPAAPPPPIANPRRRRALAAEETRPLGGAGTRVYVTDEGNTPVAVGTLLKWARDPDGCWVGKVRTTSITDQIGWEWVGADALVPAAAPGAITRNEETR